MMAMPRTVRYEKTTVTDDMEATTEVVAPYDSRGTIRVGRQQFERLMFEAGYQTRIVHALHLSRDRQNADPVCSPDAGPHHSQELSTVTCEDCLRIIRERTGWRL